MLDLVRWCHKRGFDIMVWNNERHLGTGRKFVFVWLTGWNSCYKTDRHEHTFYF